MPSDYSDPEFQILTAREAIRARPGMYIGSTDSRGLHLLLLSLVDESISEWLVGSCKCISVDLLADGGCCVRDDGAGLPVEWVEKSCRRAAEVMLTDLPAGRVPPGPRVHLGAHGVSLCTINALSKRFLIRFSRAGKTWEQEYLKGTPVSRLEAMCDAVEAGMCITFWPDEEIFKVSCAFDHQLIRTRLFELSFLFPGLELNLHNFRESREGDRFHSANGAVEFLQYLNREKQTVGPCIKIRSEVFDAKGRHSTLDCALQWISSPDGRIRSFANGYETKSGGAHLHGLRVGLSAAIREIGKTRNVIADPPPTIAQIAEHLMVVLSVCIPDPRFASATREYLGNPDMGTFVESEIKRQLASFLDAHPNDAVAILDQIMRSGSS